MQNVPNFNYEEVILLIAMGLVESVNNSFPHCQRLSKYFFYCLLHILSQLVLFSVTCKEFNLNNTENFLISSDVVDTTPMRPIFSHVSSWLPCFGVLPRAR